MPVIKTYEASAPPVRADDRAATAYETIGRRIGPMIREAYGEVSRGLEDVSNVAEQHATDLETIQANKDLAATNLAAHQAQDDFLKAHSPGDPDWSTASQTFQEQQKDQYDKLPDKYQTRGAQKYAADRAAQSQESLGLAFIGKKAEAEGQYGVQSSEDTINLHANTAAVNPATLAGQLYQNASDIRANKFLPKVHQDDMISKGNQVITDSALSSSVSAVEGNPNSTPADIDAVKAHISDPKQPFLQNASPGSMDTALRRLDALKATRGAQTAQIAAQDFSDRLEQIKTTGVDAGGQGAALVDGIKNSGAKDAPVVAAKMQKDLDKALSYGQAAAPVHAMSEPDALAHLADLNEQYKTAPPHSAGNIREQLEAVTQAITERDKAFNADPAGYTIQNSAAAGNAYQTFKQKPTPQSFKVYADTSAAEQTRLYPGVMPNLVTQEMADAIGGALQGVTTDPQGAQRASQVLQSYAQTTGTYWPQVSAELFAKKVINPDQFVAASMYDRPGGASVAQDILSASGMKPEELAKNSASSTTEAKASAAAQAAFAPLAKTMGNAGNGHQLISAYEGALTKVILYRGLSTNDAKTVAAKMINDQFQFRDTLRMPQNVNADDVVRGSKQLQAGADKLNLVVPPSLGALGPDNAKKAYATGIATTGHWFTNEDGSGAILYDENNQIVKENVGGRAQPVERKWADLSKPSFIEQGEAVFTKYMGQ